MTKNILFSPPDFIPNEIPALIALFQAGLSCFHLRKNTQEEAEVLAYVAQIPAEFRLRLMIHNHHKVAEKFEVRGLHFNKNIPLDLNKNYKNFFVSQSVHSFEEIENINKRVNYVFLSPIFDSISKQNYFSKFEAQELSQFLYNYKGETEIMALGGINAENAPIALKYGFRGVGVLGWIWDDFRENQSVERILQKWRLLNMQ